MNHKSKYYLLLFLFLLASCSPWNQTYFIEESFGFNLKEATVGKKVEEKGGLFIVYGVEEDEPILNKAFFHKKYISTDFVQAFHNDRPIGNDTWGSTIAKLWKSFDGYVQMSIYYPNKKILVFGYFTDYGG